MQVLKIEENKREELNEKGIVICSYKTIEDLYISAISLDFKNEYPSFEIVEVIIEEDL